MLDPGLAALLERSMLNYDDSMLRLELSNAADEINRNGGITEDLFVAVAQSASTGFIPPDEARRMFRRGLLTEAQLATLAESRGRSPSESKDRSDAQIVPSLLDVLFKALFKRLLVLHLTRDVCNHRLLVPSSSKCLDFYQTRSIGEPTQKNKGKKKGRGMQHLRSTTPLNDLRSQLAKSGMVQQLLDKKIASSLTLLSQTVTIGDRTSAAAFSKQVGTRKVEVLLHKKLNKYYYLYFGRWKSTHKSVNAEIFSTRFLRLYGTTKVWEYAMNQVTKKKLRYIKKWYMITMSIQRADVEASVVAMQRIVRGGLGRARVRRQLRDRAAVTIQRRHRGYLGRQCMEARKDHLRLVAAVRVVECAYQKHIWIRAGNRMRLMLKRDRACRKIQRAQRLHRANLVIINNRRKRLERRMAIKIQAQWRRYLSSVYVDGVRREHLWEEAALTLQRVTRGMLTRLFLQDEREMALAALTLQCAWRSCVARAVVRERRRHFRATVIQSAVRGRWGRKRFRRIYDAHHDAFSQITRVVCGYRDRRKYKPILAAFTARRNAASSVLSRKLAAVRAGMVDRHRVHHMRNALIRLQMCARRFLLKKRARLRDEKRRNGAAKLIQRVGRGYNARKRVADLHAKKEEQDKRNDRNKVPLYYRIYDQYLRDQFLLHRPMVLRLQCFFRAVRAWRRTDFLRRTKATQRIQDVYRRHLQTKHARAVLRQKKLERIYRNDCGTHINKVVRGFLSRRHVGRIRKADTVKWFLDQIRAKGLASRVFDSFRMRKRNMAKAITAASKIQGLVRGRAGRNFTRYNHKRLVKERRLRILRKRNKAARHIQALYHIMLAKNVANMKREERAVREAEEKLEQDLENRIDGIHGEHMIGLMTTRMQTGARAKLARK